MGPGGLSVPFTPESFTMLSFKSIRPYAYIFLGALVVVTVLFEWIRRSALGYRLRAIKTIRPRLRSSASIRRELSSRLPSSPATLWPCFEHLHERHT